MPLVIARPVAMYIAVALSVVSISAMTLSSARVGNANVFAHILIAITIATTMTSPTLQGECNSRNSQDRQHDHIHHCWVC